MITVKGLDVTLTGKDAKNLNELAATLKVSPQEAFDQALRYRMSLDKAAKKTKRSK
jgi:hypothetical protein